MKKFFLLPLLLSFCLSASAQSSAELSFGELTCGYNSVLGEYYDVEIVLDNRLGVLGKTSDYLSWVLTKQIIRRYLGNNYIEH